MRGRYRTSGHARSAMPRHWWCMNRTWFFRRFQSHVFEQDLLQLFGALQVHLLPRELPRRFLCLGSVGGKLVAHLHQTCHIHLGADLFHAMQDLRDRKLNGFEETELFALIQHTGQIFGQKPHDCGAGEYQLVVLGIVFLRLVEVQGPLCRGFGLCFDVQIKEMGRSLFQRVRVEIRVDKISGELGVEQWFRKFHADAAQQMRMFFVTVHDHGMVIAVEQPLQALHHIRTEYVDANGFACTAIINAEREASPGLLVPSA